ncbi:MAG: hypothetical protein JNM27_18820 [Leptospirales bacterium]|nr:hypothetical protein [Leptospirales bacterium]
MLLPILTFVAISFIIGIYSAGQIGGKVKNYFVAGNIIPFWVLAMSQTGQAIEIGGTFNNAFYTFSGGFWGGNVLATGIGISLILTGFFFAEPLNKMKLLTLPDFYFRRYDKRVELLVSVLCVLSFATLLAANVAGVGILFQFIFGWPPLASVIGISILVMVYTMAGGLFAVTWNDILQIGVTIVGFVAACVYLLSSLEPEVLGKVLQTNFSWQPLYKVEPGVAGPWMTWGTLAALALGDIVALDFMERVFAAKTPRAARTSCLLAGSITILVGITMSFIGAVATHYYAPEVGVKEGPAVILQFAQEHLPQGIAMMVLVGLVGACISTADGVIMSTATVITRNILQKNFPNLIPQQRLLFYSRWMCVPVTLLAIIFAHVKPDPGDLLVLSFDMVFAGCLVPLVLGVYWKKGTANAALYAIIIPSLLRVVLFVTFRTLELAPQHLWGIDTLIPPVVSVIIYVSISLIEQRKPQYQAQAA